MKRSRPVGLLLCVLVIGSLLVPMTALGQSSEYSETLDTADARYVGIEPADDWSAGTFEVEIVAQDGPGGEQQVLLREDVTLADFESTANGHMIFENARAYDTLTVTVSGFSGSDPKVDIGSAFGQLSYENKASFGTTGGDRDMSCNTDEKLWHSTNPAVNVADCNVPSGTVDSVDESLNTTELEVSLYQSGQNQKASTDNFHTVVSNRLNDAAEVARMKGKQAYIESLNNGDSKSAAKSAAKQAAADHYSLQQMNLIAEWEKSLAHGAYMREVSENQSDIDDYFVERSINGEDSYDAIDIRNFDTRTTTVTLANGTDTTVTAIDAYHDGGSGSYANSTTIGITMGNTTVDNSQGAQGARVTGSFIHPPNSNFDRFQWLELWKFKDNWNRIEQQNSQVQSDMDSLAEATYDGYQQGEINNSDLIDPYILSNQYSPGSEYETWAASTLALTGTNQPADMDNFGYFNLTLENGEQLQGIVQSPENPPSGQFEVNQTYNPEQINGTQYVTTSDRVRELNQNFTIEKLTTADGANVQNVTIEKKTYNVSNADELGKIYTELSSLQAQLEARETNLGGGGGALAGIPGLEGLDQNARIVVLVAVLVLGYGFVSRD